MMKLTVTTCLVLLVSNFFSTSYAVVKDVTGGSSRSGTPCTSNADCGGDPCSPATGECLMTMGGDGSGLEPRGATEATTSAANSRIAGAAVVGGVVVVASFLALPSL